MRDILISSSVLILAILLLRTLIKGKVNPRIQYALWLLAVIRLILPIPLGNSRFSVMNLFPESISSSEFYASAGMKKLFNVSDMNAAGALSGADATSDAENAINTGGIVEAESQLNIGGTFDIEKQLNIDGTEGTKNQLSIDGTEGIKNQLSIDGAAGTENQSSIGGAVAAESSINKATASDTENILNTIHKILFLIWMAGFLIIGVYIIFYQRKWKRYLYTYRKPLARMEKYKGRLSVYTVKGLPSPCLSGDCIYLTEEMAEDKNELSHILAHEYCHYKQLDSLWVIVRCGLLAVYWFNPLVWAAAYVSKQDSELACDAAVICLLGEDERLSYGKTLLKLVSADVYDRCRVGIVSTMSGCDNSIKERISMIAKKPKNIAAAGAAVFVIAVVLTVVTFSGAGQKNADDSIQNQNNVANGSGISGVMLDTAEASQNTAEASQYTTEISQNTVETSQSQDSAETLQDKAENLQDRSDALQDMLSDEREALKNAEREAVRAAELAKQAELKKLEAEAKVKEAALIAELDKYDSDLSGKSSSTVRKLSDYMVSYVNQGEAALDEGIYRLLQVQGDGGSTDISIYGMYTKEYGCKGIKILTGEDVNSYAIDWLPSGLLYIGKNISIYDKAEDGQPRVFIWKKPEEDREDAEIWDLYICDRYDTGTIELAQFTGEEYFKQIRERMVFGIEQAENKISVYDGGEKIGEVDVSAALDLAAQSEDGEQRGNVAKIERVVLNENYIGWELGENDSELKLITVIGLKLEGVEEVWYQGLNMITFPVNCGSFGERRLTFGKAEISTDYVSKIR